MRRFSQVDVFTAEFLLGNPVAVVHDADDIPDSELAAFARWTNLSETTFLLAPTDPAADYRLRIFTPGRELPFAGHPTLGSARAWLEAGGQPRSAERIVQQCGAGLVELRRVGDRLAFAAPPLMRSGPVEPGLIARVTDALGLTAAQVRGAQWADNGPGWIALLLSDAETVLSIDGHRPALAEFAALGVIGACPQGGSEAGSDADFEVRAFAGLLGVTEDPVTGSLNAAIAQWLIPAGLAPDRYLVSQGTQMQRRGRLYVERAGDDIWIGGDTVIGVSGTVAL